MSGAGGAAPGGHGDPVSGRAPPKRDGYGGTPFRAARKESLLVRAVPVAGDLPDYGARKARGDLIAALTVAALAVPSAMAYAELAGLTAVAGLYALLLPTVAYALFGSSRRLVIGPEGSISALVGATVAGHSRTRLRAREDTSGRRTRLV